MLGTRVELQKQESGFTKGEFELLCKVIFVKSTVKIEIELPDRFRVHRC